MKSKRLQVLLDEDELRKIQRIAKTLGMTVAEWVRQALRSARQSEPLREASRKLEVVRAAERHSYPTGDIVQLLSEMEKGDVGQAAAGLR